MKWKSNRVLITGAGGFIGSHLVERLVNSGADVTAFVRYNSRNDYGLIRVLPKQIINSIKVYSGDIRDPNAVNQAAKDAEIVFHLAASISIPYSYVNPREVIETNIIGTFNVLSAVRGNNASRLIHISSSETYGTALYAPIDENHPLQAQSPYSGSKIAADKIVESFWKSFATPVVTIKPFNSYGPRQSARAVIPTIITQIIDHKEIRLGSLNPTRDFTFVTDTVEAFICAAERDNIEGQVINVGSGLEISINELAIKIMQIMNKDAQIIQEDVRVRPKTSEVEKLIANSSKALALLGWKPTITLRQGLEQTIEWIKSNKHLYNSNMYIF